MHLVHSHQQVRQVKQVRLIKVYLNNQTDTHLSEENKSRKTPNTLELNQENFSKSRHKGGLYEKKLNVTKLHIINKK